MMNSQKEVKRLLRVLKKDFGDWNHNMIRFSFDEPHQDLKKYLANSPDFVSVSSQFGYLKTWYFTLYAAGALNRHQYSLTDLAIASKYAAWDVLVNEPLARQNRGGSILIDRATFYFSLQIICGWKRRTMAVGDALIEGLDTPMLDLRITDRHDKGTLFPHFWFLMNLFGLARGSKPIDTSLYSYPDNLGPYDQVLADWKTTDLSKVHEWVVNMAEHHVQFTDDSDPDGKNEFDWDDAKLFPYEILAYLRLREWAGLTNPSEFDHPLMQQPLAYLPLEATLPDPDTPLLDQVIARYRQEFPDLRIPDGL
jgi:hypothetical protein